MAILRLFASAREAAGVARVEVEGTSVEEVLGRARERFGADFSVVLERSRVWVNGQPAAGTQGVGDYDVVSVLPPVSGGAGARTAPAPRNPPAAFSETPGPTIIPESAVADRSGPFEQPVTPPPEPAAPSPRPAAPSARPPEPAAPSPRPAAPAARPLAPGDARSAGGPDEAERTRPTPPDRARRPAAQDRPNPVVASPLEPAPAPEPDLDWSDPQVSPGPPATPAADEDLARWDDFTDTGEGQSFFEFDDDGYEEPSSPPSGPPRRRRSRWRRSRRSRGNQDWHLDDTEPPRDRRGAGQVPAEEVESARELGPSQSVAEWYASRLGDLSGSPDDLTWPPVREVGWEPGGRGERAPEVEPEGRPEPGPPEDTQRAEVGRRPRPQRPPQVPQPRAPGAPGESVTVFVDPDDDWSSPQEPGADPGDLDQDRPSPWDRASGTAPGSVDPGLTDLPPPEADASPASREVLRPHAVTGRRELIGGSGESDEGGPSIHGDGPGIHGTGPGMHGEGIVQMFTLDPGGDRISSPAPRAPVTGNLAVLERQREPVPRVVPEPAPPTLSVIPGQGRSQVPRGLVWGVVTVAALLAGTAAMGAWLAVGAGVATLQATRQWLRRDEEPILWLSGALAAGLPLGAIFGMEAAMGVLAAGVVVAMATRALRPTASPLRDIALSLSLALPPGIAAMSVVLVSGMERTAVIVLLALVVAYDIGAFLVGSGSPSSWEGAVAGIACIVPVTLFAAVVASPPFPGGSPLLLGAIAALLVPLGPRLARVMVGGDPGRAPALARLDSLLVMAPLWGWTAAALLG